MKIALVHDYIKEYGGAERVLEALHEIWPASPVYTTVYLPKFLGPHKERFKNPPGGEANWDIRTSFLQYLPFKEKLISPFRVIAPFVFRMFDLSDYDIVIVSATGAYIKNLKSQISNLKSASQSSKLKQRLKTNDQRPLLIYYCHTPPRYLYGFATAREWKKNIFFLVIGEIASHFLRLVDYRSAQNVDYFIANSKNVAGRIKKFYRRDAKVIYPPVDINFQKTQKTQRIRISDKSEHQKVRQSDLSDFPKVRPSEFSEYSGREKTYFLAGGRLARPKHIDLIVRACQELKVPLKIFGKGFGGWDIDTKILRYKDIKKKKEKSPNILVSQYPNIQSLGEVSDEEKMDLMRNAKAYIFASEDEDFGITPVEAMSVGTPVIAYKSGGVIESLVEGKTGIFFDELTVESLKITIEQLNNVAIRSSDCIKQAQKFSKERFKKEIKKFAEDLL